LNNLDLYMHCGTRVNFRMRCFDKCCGSLATQRLEGLRLERLPKWVGVGDCRNETGLKSCYCYEVVAKPDNVVQSAFMHEKFLDDSGEVPLVVATRQELSSFNI